MTCSNDCKLLSLFVLQGILLILAGCGGSSGSGTDPIATSSGRSFHMGFTTWPYGDSLTQVTTTYTMIQDHADMVAQHLMEGIPWQESLDDAPLPDAVENDITFRINLTPSDKPIYLAIDALNTARDDLALNWGETGATALPVPWSGYNFESIQVADAYSKFALRMIDRFNPAYFNYATEVSELILNQPDRFAQFKTFASRVYQTIKTAHPDLPLMVSIALKSPNSADTQTIQANFSEIADYVDVVGISVYPYAFYDHADKGDPANLPANWLSQITTIAPDKAYAVTETGWIAENLVIDGFGYSEQSDTDKQNDYVKLLLTEAEALPVDFVIWFSIVDFDALWNDALGQDDLSKIWKDTGLYDEFLNPRPSLTSWDDLFLKDKI